MIDGWGEEMGWDGVRKWDGVIVVWLRGKMDIKSVRKMGFWLGEFFFCSDCELVVRIFEGLAEFFTLRFILYG